jgi:PAS domain S-box-containing protein
MPSDQETEAIERMNAELQEMVAQRTLELMAVNRNLQAEIGERIRSERIIIAQRDLGLALTGTTSVLEALRLCLDTAIRVADFDSGGIYIVDPVTGELNLSCVQGTSDAFADQVRHVPADSDKARRVMSGQPSYLDREALLALHSEDVLQEGIKAVAVIPISNQNRIIGTLNVASHLLGQIPPYSRNSLELIATQIGAAIIRAQANDALRFSEERYRNLMEDAPIGFCVVDTAGTIQYINKIVEEKGGWTRGELIGKNGFTLGLFDPETTAKLVERLAVRLAGGSPGKLEIPLTTKNGQQCWMEIITTLIRQDAMPIGAQLAMVDITERRQAEAVLRESEARLRQVIDLVPHFIFAKNRHGRFILVNQAVAEAYGTTVADLTGKSDGDFNPNKDEVEHFQRDDYFVMDTGKPKVIPEEIITDAQGHAHILKTTKIPFTLSLTGDKAMLGVSTDITEYKRAEKAIQESEAKYRNLFDNAVEGIFQTTTAGQFLSANPSLARMVGCGSPQEMMENLIDLKKTLYVDPEDRIRLLTLVKDKGSVKGFETRMYRKDGTIISTSINVHAIYDESGEIAHLEGTVEDITNRKRIEQALQESEEKYRNVVESSIVGFYIIQDDMFRFVNQQFCIITGHAYDDVVDIMGPMDVVHPDDHVTLAGNVEKRLTGQEKYVEYELRVIRKDGQVITVTVFGSSMIYHGRTAIVGTFIDKTHEKSMEQQLQQSQKMEAIGTLAGGIAHDFNNILGAMMGYAELAKFKTADVTIRTYLERILKACERAKDLVNRILTFSRQEKHEKKPLSVTPIVQEAMKLIRSSLPATVEIRFSHTNRLDTVLADATQIHQVLINLCTNAAHAMRERGGVLEVQLAQQDIDADSSGYGPELREGSYLKLVVSDTGHGIDPAIMNKVFDPFFTTKGPGEGTGLGLSMVYGIVKNHGGAISATSKSGQGTTFTIYLPLIDTAGQAEEQGTDAIPVGRGHILFVDDEEPLASIGKEMLAFLGYDVTVRFSSLDALEAFRANPNRFDLVITDTTMPNMTGAFLATEMLRIRPGLPIILTTGFSEKINEAEAKKIGIKEFIMKPVSLGNLAQAVRRVLDQTG